MKKAKTHCPQGHPYSGDNLVLHPINGGRECLVCRRERKRRYKQKQKAK